MAEIGDHRVMYLATRLAEGERGGAPDKEVGRMIAMVTLQYLEENPDEMVCFCHADNRLSRCGYLISYEKFGNRKKYCIFAAGNLSLKGRVSNTSVSKLFINI